VATYSTTTPHLTETGETIIINIGFSRNGALLEQQAQQKGVT